MSWGSTRNSVRRPTRVKAKDRDFGVIIKWMEYHTAEFIRHGMAVNDIWGERSVMSELMPPKYYTGLEYKIAMFWSAINCSKLYNMGLVMEDCDGNQYTQLAMAMYNESKHQSAGVKLYFDWFRQDFLQEAMRASSEQQQRFIELMLDLSYYMCKNRYGELG